MCNKIIRFVRLYTAHSTFKWSFAGDGGGGLQITAKLQFRTSSNYHPIIKHIQLSQWLIKAFIRQKVKLF